MNDFNELIEIFRENRDIDSASVEKFISFLSHPQASEIELAAVTAAWKAKGEKSDELVEIAQYIAQKLPIIETSFPIIDCCGTGGDNSQTFNISTASAIVAASVGVKVAKHGGRKTTSASGSIDFAEALGLPTFSEKAEIERSLNEHGFALISSPALHNVLGRWKQVCKKIEFAGQTGIIGTLTNPVKITHQIIGVPKPEWGNMMIESLKRLGRQKAAVIHGQPKLDELSLCGKTKVWLLENNFIEEFEIDPKEFGWNNYYALSELKGGSSEENAALFLELLSRSKNAPKPILDIIIFNTAFILWIYGNVPSIEVGIERAKEAIESGKALKFFESLKRI